MAKVADLVIICVVVLALDMAAGLLGILAQAARNKVSCDPKAYQFGVAAAVLFMAAHAPAAGNCDCICPQLKDIRASMRKGKLDLIIGAISSAVFAVGVVLLIAGTERCGFLHGHAVGIGAILCFIDSGIITAYYIRAIASYREAPGEHP